MPDQANQAEPDTVNVFLAGIPDLTRRSRFPSLDPERANAVFKAMLDGGDSEAAILSVVGELNERDDGSDWKARFILHALGTHACGKGKDAERAKVEAAFVKALQADHPAAIKTFLTMQLQYIAQEQSIESLIAQFAANDVQLTDAVAATLTAIGELCKHLEFYLTGNQSRFIVQYVH